jgi:long-subunit fatty acid transport protein
MKLSLFKVTVMFVVVLATTAYSQHEGMSFNFFGGGARAEGMGNAFLAISDDGSAASWNPAGLQIHEKTMMTFSYGFFQPRGEYSFYHSSNDNSVFNHAGTMNSMNYWHIISPLRIKGHHFVVDFGYTRNFDIYNFFGESLIRNQYDPNPNAFSEKTGGLSSINLGFGTRFYSDFSFGITGNIYTGTGVTVEDRNFTDIVYTNISNTGTAFYESNVRLIDSSSFSGFNATIGLMFNNDVLRAGLVIRTPFVLHGESDNTIFRQATLNGVPVIVDMFNNPHYTIYHSDTTYIDDIAFKMEMPLMVGFGLGYNISEKWLMAGDVEYRGFDGKIVEILENRRLTASGDAIEIFSPLEPNWTNIWQFRFGTEYLFDTPIGEVPLRMGFRTEAYPQGDISSFDIIYTDEDDITSDSTTVFYSNTFDADSKTTGYSISFGSGIHWSQIILDFAYTMSVYDQNIYRTTDILRAVNDWKNHHINLTFTGYF